VKVYENLDALPRAFVVHQAWEAGDGEEALAYLAAPGFDPATEVVIEGEGSGLSSVSTEPTEGTIRWLSYTPEQVEMEVELSAPGYLVLTDAIYPGWQAWVNGEEVEIRTANILFRAVQLDPGQQRVVFAYQPRSVVAGRIISLVAIVVLIAGPFALTVARKRTTRDE
jgi:hypothetical protein